MDSRLRGNDGAGHHHHRPRYNAPHMTVDIHDTELGTTMPLARAFRRLAPLLALLAPFAAAADAYQIPPDSPVAAALQKADAAIAAIVAIPDDERTIDNTLGAFDDVMTDLQVDTWYVQLMASVSPDEAERERGWRALRDEADWATGLDRREDLYHAVRAVADRVTPPAGEPARYLAHALRDYRRAGMDLPAEQRSRLSALERELNDLALQFERNITDDETRILLTADELAGTPAHVLDELAADRSDDLYLVRLDEPLIGPLLDYCDVAATRHKIFVAARRQGGQRNVALLRQILRLRAEHARLLGYADAAAYGLEIEMARDVDTVRRFYADLLPRVQQLALREREELTAAKRAHTGDPDARLFQWDQSYYEHRLLRERYAVDHEAIRAYFPFDHVLAGLFDIAGRLFDLRFVELSPANSPAHLPRWHADVRLWEVRDADGALRGHLYVDPFPRPGKDGGAWQWGVLSRKTYTDGRVQTPVIVLVCNVTSPGAGRPPLLTHTEVVTLFHEFGHTLHSLLSETRYARFSGTRVATDFVEFPSQMLENWAWDRDVLARITRHFETGAPLPAEQLDALLRARRFCGGLRTLAQIWLGQLDLRYHTLTPEAAAELDTTAVSTEVYESVMLRPAPPNTFVEAGFGHLMGYQAGYYSYLWALVYAQDAAARFQEAGMLSPDLGRAYRTTILARGGSVDEMDMLVDFLGRPPRIEPFIEYLGLAGD